MHILKSALFAASVAVLAGNVAAQCSNYANTGNAGTVVLDVDEGIRTVGLPFSFPFNGLSINQMTISSNGWIKLGATTTTTSAELGETEALMLGGNARLALLWDDLNAAVAGAGEIYYAADATQASVTFQNVPHFGSTQTAVKANCECILQPSGDIYFYYDSTSAYNLSSSSSIVGISRGNTGPALTAGTHLVDWSTASSTPINVVDATAYQLFTSTTGLSPFDLTGGVVLHFAPTGVDTYTVTTTTLSTCTPGTYPPLAGATVTSVGIGCPKPRSSIYELFTSNAGLSPIDLANTSIEFVKSGDDYLTIPGPGFDATYNVGGTILAGVGDDTATTVSLAAGLGTFQLGTNTPITSVQVLSNGAIGLPTGPTTANPAAASFHTAGARAAAAWADMVPNTTTAPIYVENTASFFRATWQAVPLFTDGGSHTFQITLMPSGNIIYSYAAMSGGATKAFLTGLVGSTTAVDTGSVNLFTGGAANSLTNLITGTNSPLSHTISSAPRIGQNWTMNAAAPANNLGVGVFAVGATNPNVALDVVYGPGSAPGCTIYNDLLETFFVLFTPNATTFSLTLPIPYDVGLTGLPLFSQAALFAPLNGAGIITSNGLSFTTGL